MLRTWEVYFFICLSSSKSNNFYNIASTHVDYIIVNCKSIDWVIACTQPLMQKTKQNVSIMLRFNPASSTGQLVCALILTRNLFSCTKQTGWKPTYTQAHGYTNAWNKTKAKKIMWGLKLTVSPNQNYGLTWFQFW